MARAQSHRPIPLERPRPLPHQLLASLLERGRLLLCLDYDGTLSEITPDIARAIPVPRAREAIASIALSLGWVTVAIVSGRDLATVRRLLGVDSGIMFAGTHGLELIGPDGVTRLAPGVEESLDDLQALRDHLAREVPAQRGFVVEDKRLAIAFHYRKADPTEAAPLLAHLEEFVASVTPRLEIIKGKMVYEMLPRGVAGKGSAVRWFIEQMGEPRTQVAYFGDDTTDEDAFFALRPQDAVTVLVGPERESFARYRVDGPSAVADLLAELSAMLASERRGKQR